uniref:Uncharacterized protein n=1 Tax=Pipistrellus kuhlii TaxID=59472 RepID=A0A7J7S5Y9_PIPKU|nr:hypothetical protein mPipKuh1_010040 [Pipistrellus kuhlii]
MLSDPPSHTPPAQLQMVIFCLLLKNKNPEAKVERGCGLSRWREGHRGLVPALPSSSDLPSPGLRLGQSVGEGQSLRGQGNRALRGSPREVPGLEGRQELWWSWVPRPGSKARRVGQAPYLATEKRFWVTGCWFIYCGVPRANRAPLWDQEAIYTTGRRGARDQACTPPCRG